MEEGIHEYNYKEKGFNKYVISFLFEDRSNESTMKVFAKSEEEAKGVIVDYLKGYKIIFTDTYIC